MKKLRITWEKLMVDEIDIEEHYGMTYEEFKELSEEEQAEVEWDAIDNIRERIVIIVAKTEYV